MSPFHTVLSSALILLSLSACGGGTEEAHEAPIRPVKLVTVEATSNEFPVSYPAVVAAAQSSALTFQVGGLLQELPVDEGDLVEAGALIAKLDQRDFQNNLASAQAQYNNAQSEYQRAARLLEQDAISRSAVEARRSARDVAKAQLDTAQKAFDDTELRAPFTGQVATVNVENFQNVAPQQPIVTLQSVGAVEAVIDVPARIIAFIPQINPVNTVVILDAAPQIQIPATVKEVSGQSDPTTQTYRARFNFTPPEDFLILPGMTGTVESNFVYLGDQVDLGVAVPVGAIMVEGDQRFVWIVDEETMTVSRRDVQISEDRVGEEIGVVAGLEGGEVIAGAGASYLFEGMQVRAWDGAQ
ncbi:MAG: efflux RND transporter periplasmic adaptor subunit [Parvularculaceae bacterium]|nr:efflux RND transporter periplasmic adaptor subunit [Parvularculaceae bacterium]